MVDTILFPNGEGLADELRRMADALESFGLGYGGPRFQMRVSFGGNHVAAIKCNWEPEALRERAAEFDRQLRRTKHRRPSPPSNKSPSLRRAAYSDKLANAFLSDGEIENYRNYRELYGLDPNPSRR